MRKNWKIVNYVMGIMIYMNARFSMIWRLHREANFWQSRSCVMVAMKVFKQNTQHITVQKEEHVRSVMGSILLVYMVSSTKRKMGQQKVIPNINKGLRQAIVQMLMTSRMN